MKDLCARTGLSILWALCSRAAKKSTEKQPAERWSDRPERILPFEHQGVCRLPIQCCLLLTAKQWDRENSQESLSSVQARRCWWMGMRSLVWGEVKGEQGEHVHQACPWQLLWARQSDILTEKQTRQIWGVVGLPRSVHPIIGTCQGSGFGLL